MEATYIYNRKDGGTTYCYGKVKTDSNFELVCDNEYKDGYWTDNECFTTWKQVCTYLESAWSTKIEQITAV